MTDDTSVLRLDASVMLVGNAGARNLEVGYLHDDVPSEEAGWYATALYQGAKIMVEDHPGPVEAVEALAEKLLIGARCQWCQGLVALGTAGAVAYPGSPMADGSKMPEDPEVIRAMGQCLWRRVGDRWEPGCIHGQSSAPGAPQDRPARRRLDREFRRTRRPGRG